ncbi:MAG: family 43 glycosylhydrolase [Eubacterium sp.]|nr:family 43 glycosylhydrolase [Eubacterium sp.]
MKAQAFNPFLPLYEYVPDGEPHRFGDRIYLYGSHDREGGHTFCMEDYVVYSAPVSDLTDWRYEGVSYRADQDPEYNKTPYLFAPDVVRGNDGRYYLYYGMGGEYGIGGYSGTIRVAVSDQPGGPFSYLGYVRNADGTPMKKYICFDPAVINDDGVIRLYYGTQYGYEEAQDFRNREDLIRIETEMFGISREELLSYTDSINGANMLVLEDDMLTVREEARHILPYPVCRTDFAEHPFFEGSSIRKIGATYYFIYSSWLNHELCYATSLYPDRGFKYGGTIVSNGDVGLNGRKAEDRVNMTGTTHGSIVCADGQWYVFYHRLTHKSDYSRQACAEKITIAPDGSIAQVPVTSCGLNPGALRATGTYPAVIACQITNGHMPHGSNSVYSFAFPHVTHRDKSGEARTEDDRERFIAEIADGTRIGYKYFSFPGPVQIGVEVRFETEHTRPIFNGPLRIDERCEESLHLESDRVTGTPGITADEPYLEVFTDETGSAIGSIPLSSAKSEDPFAWIICRETFDMPSGDYPLFFVYHGKESLQMKTVVFG